MNTSRAWQGVVAILFASCAMSGEAAGTANPELPPFPAAIQCEDCTDTLSADHELIFISRLSFPHGSAQLTREASLELLRLLAELESFAAVKRVEIVGHADPSGPENYNRWISENRAKRVQDYLEQQGLDPRKTSARGVGSSEPLTGAIDPSEHRRVEIHITLQPFLASH